MKLFLNEIKEIERDFHFSQDDEWVLDTVLKIDEEDPDRKLEFRPSQKTKKKRPIEVHLTANRLDEIYVIRGSIDAYQMLLCSRCAQSFQFDSRPRFTSLFSKDPKMAGIAHFGENGDIQGHNRGLAKATHEVDEGPVFNGDDIDITYLSEDFIDLKEVLMEQLQLKVPFKPLCSEDCKGICANCGSDLNEGRCACKTDIASSPFMKLKDFDLEKFAKPVKGKNQS